MAESYSDFNPVQMDLLKEIGNIGAGNAATTLSQMLSKRVDMTVPRVRFLEYGEIANLLGGPENQIVGILLKLSEGVDGMMMFLMEESFAHTALNVLMGKDLKSFDDVTEMDLSALQEIGNIMAGSYVGALAGLTNMYINISPPEVSLDMAGAILSVPAIEFAKVGDKVLFIEEEFVDSTGLIKSFVLLIPEMHSLEKIMAMFGI